MTMKLTNSFILLILSTFSIYSQDCIDNYKLRTKIYDSYLSTNYDKYGKFFTSKIKPRFGLTNTFFLSERKCDNCNFKLYDYRGLGITHYKYSYNDSCYINYSHYLNEPVIKYVMPVDITILDDSLGFDNKFLTRGVVMYNEVSDSIFVFDGYIEQKGKLTALRHELDEKDTATLKLFFDNLLPRSINILNFNFFTFYSDYYKCTIYCSVKQKKINLKGSALPFKIKKMYVTMLTDK